MEHGVPTLLYEAGEALRFDEESVRVGLNGVVRVMRTLGMLSGKKLAATKIEPVRAQSSYWVRASAGGILRAPLAPGAMIEDGGTLGMIADPFGETEVAVTAQDGGILIGRTNLPVVNQGDGLFHIARVRDADTAQEKVDRFRDQMDQSAPADEFETV